MRRFKNILAVVDTSHERHPALEKAAQLARQNQARLLVVDVVPDFGWPARMAVVDTESIHELLVKEKHERLDSIAAPLVREGLLVRTLVLSGKSSREIVREVEDSAIDLVVRTTKGQHSRREEFLGTTSIRLLRFCPCPVWLIKPDAEDKFHRIVAAVDAGTFDEDHASLNHSVLEMARSLASSEDSSLQVVYAWTIFGENVLRDRLNADEFAELEAATLGDQERMLDKVLTPFGLSARSETVHLLRGDASYEIPRFVAEQGADLIVMGTIGRRGIAGFFIGNTAERILDKVQCSILAVKPG